MLSIPTRLLGLLLFGLSAAVVLLIVGLSFYNHASPADDYCFADTVQKYGFWQAQHYYYHGWTGRYFHNFIVHASPLSAGWLGGYKLVPVLMLGTLIWAWYRLGRAVSTAPDSRPYAAWLFTAAMLILSVMTMPSVAEFFFWLTGIAGYSLPAALVVLWLARAYRRDGGHLPGTVASVGADCLLIAALVGSSETSTLLLLSWLTLLTLGKWLQTRTLPGYVGVYWTVAIISILFLVLAPGNAIRLGTGSAQRDVVGLLTQSVQYTLGFVGHRLLHSPLLPLSLLYLPVAYRLTALASPFRPYANLPVGLAVLHGAATVWAMVFLHYWAVGIGPAPRVQNLIDHALLLSWLFSLTVAVRWGRTWLERAGLHTLRPALLGVVAVGLLVVTWQNEVVRQLFGDLWSGRAGQYSTAMEARYTQMQQPSSDTLTIAPLPTLPKSLVVEDIHTDPAHLWNKCWAGYFHQKAVVLRK